jgi:hypothetical protein
MGFIERFLSGLSLGPIQKLLDLMSLAPELLWASLLLLAGVILLNDLLRTALMTEHTRSAMVHAIVCILTLLPSGILGLVLLYAGYRYPDRAWINFGLSLALYIPWYLGGTLTWLARRDTEGADVGWISHGLFITVPCGLLAVVLFWARA